jgi:hypothetical protein
LEFPKRTKVKFKCFENRDNFKEKRILRNITRNQAEFKDKVSILDTDSLCRDLIDDRNAPKKIKSECKIIFGMAWYGVEEILEEVVIEHLMNAFAIYHNGRDRKIQ